MYYEPSTVTGVGDTVDLQKHTGAPTRDDSNNITG